MKKRMLQVVLGILLLVLLAIAGFGVLYAGRLRTVNSIEQLTNYDDYNLYRMGRNYDFRCDTSAMRVHCAPKNGYKLVALTAQIALRRHWDDVLYYDLNTNTIGG